MLITKERMGYKSEKEMEDFFRYIKECRKEERNLCTVNEIICPRSYGPLYDCFPCNFKHLYEELDF